MVFKSYSMSPSGLDPADPAIAGTRLEQGSAKCVISPYKLKGCFDLRRFIVLTVGFTKSCLQEA